MLTDAPTMPSGEFITQPKRVFESPLQQQFWELDRLLEEFIDEMARLGNMGG